MTRREIANLCCRVLAVYVIVQGVSEAPRALSAAGLYLSSGMPVATWAWFLLMIATHPVALLSLGIWLWRKSHVIAAWMIGHDLQDAPDEPDSEQRRPNAQEMHTIAFSTLGLWLLTTSAPELITTAVSMAVYAQASLDLPENYAQAWGINTLGPVARTIIGLVLLFGATGIASLARRASERVTQPRYRPADLERDSASPSTNHPEPPP